MKTYVAKPAEIDRKWYVVDASGKTLGRISTEIAKVLSGKNKPTYTPNVDCGDFVVVINAEKVHVTGNKAEDKLYRHHTGYPGHLKETNFNTMIKRHPERVIEMSVKGMLPKSALGRQMSKKLKVYAGDKHPHSAQQPQVLEFN